MRNSVHEQDHADLEIWRSETLPDAPSILGNLAGLCACSMYGMV